CTPSIAAATENVTDSASLRPSDRAHTRPSGVRHQSASPTSSGSPCGHSAAMIAATASAATLSSSTWQISSARLVARSAMRCSHSIASSGPARTATRWAAAPSSSASCCVTSSIISRLLGHGEAQPRGGAGLLVGPGSGGSAAGLEQVVDGGDQVGVAVGGGVGPQGRQVEPLGRVGQVDGDDGLAVGPEHLGGGGGGDGALVAAHAAIIRRRLTTVKTESSDAPGSSPVRNIPALRPVPGRPAADGHRGAARV